MRRCLQGAAEIVLRSCESVVDATGGPVHLTTELRGELDSVVTQMACKGLRTLCLAVRDFAPGRPAGFFDQPPADGLTLCGLVGIKDPVRREVPDAVATCRWVHSALWNSYRTGARGDRI